VRHHLIQPKPRRRRRDDYKRWERSRAMDLWQLDVLGGVKLTNGIGVSVVTGIDDHSRFLRIAKVVTRATARPVCDALLEALNIYGIPEQILTDNGKVFTGVVFKKLPLNGVFPRPSPALPPFGSPLNVLPLPALSCLLPPLNS
jgi:transposase InsO family protein